MAVKLRFYGTEKLKSSKRFLECYEQGGEIIIYLEDEDSEHDYNQQWVGLDKQTAIRLSRELRKQIALIE